MKRFVQFLFAISTLVAVGNAIAARDADRLYEEAVRRHADSTPTGRFALYARAAEEGHAVAHGDPDACLDLAIMLGSGDVLAVDSARARSMLDCASNGGNDSAVDYREMLDAAPDGRFEPAVQEDFWRQQKQFWVDMAAQFGVRDAEEAVGAGKPDG